MEICDFLACPFGLFNITLYIQHTTWVDYSGFDFGVFLILVFPHFNLWCEYLSGKLDFTILHTSRCYHNTHTYNELIMIILLMVINTLIYHIIAISDLSVDGR